MRISIIAALFTFTAVAWAPFTQAFTGRGSYYYPGLGACGATNTDSDAVVEISSQIFNNGVHCGQWITATVNGRTGYARVAGSCGGCGPNDLDMSPSVFQKFALLTAGVVTVTWSFQPFGFTPPK